MPALEEDLAQAKADNSPSVAAAVAAAIDKGEPSPEQTVEEPQSEQVETDEDTTGA